MPTKIPNTQGVIISHPQKFELRDRESNPRVIEQAKKAAREKLDVLPGT